MAFIDDFQTEWQTIIHAAWSDVVMPDGVNENGFKTSVQAIKAQIVEDLKTGSVLFPYVVLEFGDEITAQDWSIDGDAVYMPVTVHRIERYGAPSEGGTNQPALAAKARTLKASVDDGTHTTFQAVRRGNIDTSDHNPVLSALAADSKVQIIAASVRWDYILCYPNGDA